MQTVSIFSSSVPVDATFEPSPGRLDCSRHKRYAQCHCSLVARRLSERWFLQLPYMTSILDSPYVILKQGYSSGTRPFRVILFITMLGINASFGMQTGTLCPSDHSSKELISTGFSITTPRYLGSRRLTATVGDGAPSE